MYTKLKKNSLSIKQTNNEVQMNRIPSEKQSILIEKYHNASIKVSKDFFDKYKLGSDAYNVKQINDIVYNEKANIVANFKDFLIYDDSSEFLKRFYKGRESEERLPRLYDYYENYSKIFPNYIILPEAKFIYKNIQKKQRLIDTQQMLEANEINRKGDDDSSSYMFNTKIHESIMNVSASFSHHPQDIFNANFNTNQTLTHMISKKNNFGLEVSFEDLIDVLDNIEKLNTNNINLTNKDTNVNQHKNIMSNMNTIVHNNYNYNRFENKNILGKSSNKEKEGGIKKTVNTNNNNNNNNNVNNNPSLYINSTSLTNHNKLTPYQSKNTHLLGGLNIKQALSDENNTASNNTNSTSTNNFINTPSTNANNKDNTRKFTASSNNNTYQLSSYNNLNSNTNKNSSTINSTNNNFNINNYSTKNNKSSNNNIYQTSNGFLQVSDKKKLIYETKVVSSKNKNVSQSTNFNNMHSIRNNTQHPIIFEKTKSSQKTIDNSNNMSSNSNNIKNNYHNTSNNFRESLGKTPRNIFTSKNGSSKQVEQPYHVINSNINNNNTVKRTSQEPYEKIGPKHVKINSIANTNSINNFKSVEFTSSNSNNNINNKNTNVLRNSTNSNNNKRMNNTPLTTSNKVGNNINMLEYNNSSNNKKSLALNPSINNNLVNELKTNKNSNSGNIYYIINQNDNVNTQINFFQQNSNYNLSNNANSQSNSQSNNSIKDTANLQSSSNNKNEVAKNSNNTITHSSINNNNINNQRKANCINANSNSGINSDTIHSKTMQKIKINNKDTLGVNSRDNLINSNNLQERKDSYNQEFSSTIVSQNNNNQNGFTKINNIKNTKFVYDNSTATKTIDIHNINNMNTIRNTNNINKSKQVKTPNKKIIQDNLGNIMHNRRSSDYQYGNNSNNNSNSNYNNFNHKNNKLTASQELPSSKNRVMSGGSSNLIPTVDFSHKKEDKTMLLNINYNKHKTIEASPKTYIITKDKKNTSINFNSKNYINDNIGKHSSNILKSIDTNSNTNSNLNNLNNKSPRFMRKHGALSSNFNNLKDSSDKFATTSTINNNPLHNSNNNMHSLLSSTKNNSNSNSNNNPYGISGVVNKSKNMLLSDMMKKYQHQKQNSVSSTNSIDAKDTKDIKKYYIKSKIFK